MSRSVVSVLLRELGDFSLHPQGWPCGRRHDGHRATACPPRGGVPEQRAAGRVDRTGARRLPRTSADKDDPGVGQQASSSLS